MQEPVFTFQDSRVLVQSFGKALAYDPSSPTLEEPLLHIGKYAKAAGAKNTLWQRLSTRQNCEGRFSAVSRSWLPRNTSVVLSDVKRYNAIYGGRERDCFALVTRDCPVLVLWKKRKSVKEPRTSILAIHCSRDALQGFDVNRPHASVILESVSMCMSEWGDLRDVHGLITLGIAPEHFSNERYPHIVDGLSTRWGESVIHDPTRSTIDLVALIKAQVASLGINPSNIMHDGLDTYSDERLASTRRGHEGFHNLVLVVSK